MANPPPAREFTALAYDEAAGEIVMFGGRAGNQTLSDTWVFDGQWTQKATVFGPPGLREHSLVYDPARRRTVLFGGITETGAHNTETWEWNGADWNRRSPAVPPPPRRTRDTGVYDPETGQILFFGGDNLREILQGGLWEYGPTNPAVFANFGNGCAGSRGQPTLDAQMGTGPWVNASLLLELDNLPLLQSGVLLVATEPTAPMNLPLGGPTCRCSSVRALESGFPTLGGSATVPVQIPRSPALVGAPLFFQAVLMEAPSRLIATPGGLGIIGQR